MKGHRPGMFSRWTRREFLRTTGLTAAGVGLASSMPSLLESAAATTPVTIQYWNGWTEDAAKKVNQLIADFEKDNPNITVKNVPVSGDFNAKLLAAVASGSPPDVVTLFGAGNVYTMADQNALISLDEAATSQQIARMRKWVSPAIWDLGTYKGKVYGIAQWAQSWLILWNKNHAQEAGLPVHKGIQSLEDLLHWSEKVTKHDSHGNIIRLGFYDTALDNWLAPFGGRFTDKKGNITANDPNNVRALEYLVSFAKLYDPKKVAAFNSSLAGAGDRSATLDPFLAGKISIEENGPWELGSIINYAPKGFQYGTSYQPSPKDKPGIGTYTYGDIAAVPRGAPHAKEAWQFISYLTGASGNHTQYANLFKVWTCVNAPNSEDALGIPAFKKETLDKCAGYDKYANAFFHAKRYLFPPKLPIAAYYDTTLSTAVQKALLLQMSPKAALDQVQKQVTNEWKQYQQTHH